MYSVAIIKCIDEEFTMSFILFVNLVRRAGAFSMLRQARSHGATFFMSSWQNLQIILFSCERRKEAHLRVTMFFKF